jgi:hypothetical protein
MKLFLANLSLVAMVLQIPLAAVIVAKKLWRTFPVFATYALSNILATAILYLIRALTLSFSPYPFFYAYWICEAVAVLLGFGLVYEVFRRIFAPYSSLRRLARVTFQWVLVGLVLLSAAAVYAQSSGEQNPLMGAVLVLEEATRIVEVGLLMFLFLFSKAFGLHWRQHIFGIALGLGIFVAVELAGVTMRAHVGPAAYAGFALARILAFATSLLIWTGFLLIPERVANIAQMPKRAQLEQWNQAVMELIHQ